MQDSEHTKMRCSVAAAQAFGPLRACIETCMSEGRPSLDIVAGAKFAMELGQRMVPRDAEPTWAELKAGIVYGLKELLKLAEGQK